MAAGSWSRLVQSRVPKSVNCKKVLNFEVAVGCTSALGRLKSQYLAMVFGAGKLA